MIANPMEADIFQQILITGADGMIGSYVDFGVRTNRESLDVTDLESVRAACRKHAPKAIIHLAADVDLNRCEKNPAHTYLVNAVGTYNMALVARECGAKLVYVSTSGVFDGTKKEPYTEEDVPNPLNQYGHSKYLGELAVQSMLDDYLIVRVSWVFGGGAQKDKKFVAKILQQLDQSEISAVSDKHGSPTYAKDAVAGIKRLLAEDKEGIYHMSNAGSATRFDIAQEIVNITKSGAKVVPVKSTDLPSTYISGENEGMSSQVHYMRPWQEALREYIDEEW
ncbi:NAD(P)-dependent oxidoreductase [Candidatus Kaiserbacteria bacterium]|nr:NAD(P)-dependent oxidoreductase [Candidatus Kaiserbacteria bacterium]